MLIDVQDDLQVEEVVAKNEVAEKEVSDADLITTAGEIVTTASARTTVDTLIEIKAAKPRLLQLLPQQLLLLLLAQDQRQKELSFMIRKSKHLH
ncbi:hypothetical protein Tco_0691743, partial [Tanacetum coccineum]